MSLRTRRVNNPYFVGNWKFAKITMTHVHLGWKVLCHYMAFRWSSFLGFVRLGHRAAGRVRVQGNATEAFPWTRPAVANVFVMGIMQAG
jgi:hypothetical protein